MYVPAAFREERTEVLQDFIRNNGFATVVTCGEQGLQASQVPLTLSVTDGALGTLRGHFAKANPHWRDLDADVEMLAVFQGPQAYVSPSWYATKREHGKVVPTWDYIAVQARGRVRRVDDPAQLLSLLEALTDHHEQGREQPWRVSDAPADYIENMTRAIVGFELTITSLEGAWKLSQNRSAADRRGVATGLAASGQTEIAGLIPE